MIIRCLLVILAVLVLFFVAKSLHSAIYFYMNSVRVKSTVDSQYYTVRDTKYKQECADTLARICQRIDMLLENLKESPGDNVYLLLDRYNRDSLMENVSLQDTSYTVNKGREIAMCLTSRDNSSEEEGVYDINKLMFVVLHELAHVGTRSRGHGDEFRHFFRFLLKKSIALGIYEFQDFSKDPQEYCGVKLDVSPCSNAKCT